MFTNESHIISCLVNKLKIDFGYLHATLFFRAQSFSFTDEIAWLFYSEQ